MVVFQLSMHVLKGALHRFALGLSSLVNNWSDLRSARAGGLVPFAALDQKNYYQKKFLVIVSKEP